MADSGLIHILNMAMADIQVRSVVHLHHLICVCQVFNSHAYGAETALDDAEFRASHAVG